MRHKGNGKQQSARRTPLEDLVVWKLRCGEANQCWRGLEEQTVSLHVGADLPILHTVRAYVIRHFRAITTSFSTATVVAGSLDVAFLRGGR